MRIGCVNHISNYLVKKMVNDIKKQFFFSIISGISIRIVICKLNKVHEMSV